MSHGNKEKLVEPALRPVVQALCQLAHCEITPLRQIESVVIDSSSFGRLRADAYRLAFSLRNQAPIDIAMPAIELSLTDTQDQPVIRRVILPTEFGAAPAVLAEPVPTGAARWPLASGPAPRRNASPATGCSRSTPDLPLHPSRGIPWHPSSAARSRSTPS